MATSNVINKEKKQINNEDQLRDTFFAKTLVNLQNKFRENFETFQNECEQIEREFVKYPQPVYSPISFDSKNHQHARSTIKEYLESLPDEDSNADLKSQNLIPVDIHNYDSDALFRSICWSVGCSREEDILELKVRCIVDAVCNGIDYINHSKELRRAAINPEQISKAIWSPFLIPKSHIDPPKIVTVYILFALAKIVNIPIRSVYPIPSTEELNRNKLHPYHLVSRTFDPPSDQNNPIVNNKKPIVIMWWCTDINGVTYSDRVIPLLPNNTNNTDQLLTSSTTVSSLPTTISTSSVVRCRGTYILISTAVMNSITHETRKRLNKMKETIFELIETIAKNSETEDIIEINTCNEELTEPALIPFCEANKVNIEENFNLINNIQFLENRNFNPSICICDAIDKLTQQSTYYDNFYFFLDSLFDDTQETNIGNSVIRCLKQTQRIHSQIIVSSEKKISPRERFESHGVVQIYSINNNNEKIRWQEIIHYGNTHSSRKTQTAQAQNQSDQYIEPTRVQTNTIVKYAQTEPSKSITINTNPTDVVASPRDSYRVPTSSPMKSFLFNPKL